MPDTVGFSSGDFNTITHYIKDNRPYPKLMKYGSFGMTMNFSHNDFVTKNNKTSGIDLRLTTLANFTPNLRGFTLMKSAMSKNGIDLTWLEKTRKYFYMEMLKYVKDRKQPLFYTSGLKSKRGKCYLENAATMLVHVKNSVYDIYVAIGEISYKARITFEDDVAKLSAGILDTENIEWHDEELYPYEAIQTLEDSRLLAAMR